MLLDQVQSLERRLGSNFFSFAARFCSRRSWLQTRNRRINRVEKLKSTQAKHPKPTTLQHANAGNAVCLSAYTRQSHESRIRPLPCLALRYLFCPGPIKSSQNGDTAITELKLLMLHTLQILSGFAGCMPHASPSPFWP